MAEDVEAVFVHRVEDELRHLRRRHLATRHRLLDHGLGDELAACGLDVLPQGVGPVALAVVDAGGHEVGAQHMGVHLLADQGQVLVQRLADRNDSVLGDVVDTHVGRVQQAGHAGCVDDVAAPARVGLRGLQHQRREDAHTMRHAHQVDADHPLPVLQRVFPDQAAGADAGIVEDEVGRAEVRHRRRAQGLDLGRFADVQAEGQHLRAQALDLGRGGLQCRVLHIGHHDAHAACGGDAAGLQPEARGRTRDDGHAVLKLTHVFSALIWKPARGKCTCTVPARSSWRRMTTSSSSRPTSAPATGSRP